MLGEFALWLIDVFVHLDGLMRIGQAIYLAATACLFNEWPAIRGCCEGAS